MSGWLFYAFGGIAVAGALAMVLNVRNTVAGAMSLVATMVALGGVYVGGGIVTKLLPKVKSGLFMDAFCDVGRFEPLLRNTPVQVIANPKTALLGAAEVALDLATL